MNTTVNKTTGVWTTTTDSAHGFFRLAHTRDFRLTSAEYSHHDATSVTFRDGRGHYAKVIGVRNGPAWVKRHGFAS